MSYYVLTSTSGRQDDHRNEPRKRQLIEPVSKRPLLLDRKKFFRSEAYEKSRRRVPKWPNQNGNLEILEKFKFRACKDKQRNRRKRG